MNSFNPSVQPSQAESRAPMHGGAREEAGRPPQGLKAVKYGSTRICKKCGRFVAKTHFHQCGKTRKKKAPFQLPSMPPDLE